MDDDPRRRPSSSAYGDRDGPPPPPPPPSRRSSPSYDGYGGREERDTRRPERPRPANGSRRDGVGGGGPRPQRRGDGESRYGRYDVDESGGRAVARTGRRASYDDRERRGRGDPRSNQGIDDFDLDDVGKSKKKKWFSLKKDKTKMESNEGTTMDDDTKGINSLGGVPPIPPPPPPPPPDGMAVSSGGVEINPAGTERTPIHYMFPTAEAAAEERKMSDDRINDDVLMGDPADGEGFPDLPFLDVEEERFADGERSMEDGRRRRRYDDDDDERERFQRRVSPRKDGVTTFMSTRRGALQVRFASAIVGAALGGFMGKSLMNDPLMLSLAMSSLMFAAGFLRNDYGELSRALGLALVLTLQRTRSVRKEYPTLPHLKAMIRQGPRKPFPPVEDGGSPWGYEPVYRDDPEFTMTYALLAMALVGSFCGGNVPILPAWMGGIAGAAAFASLAMGSNARGDLGRAMGMRIVGLVRVALDINTDLRILGKAATVGGLIFDKIMIVDRKHRIKDKIVGICKWGYDKVSRTAEQVKDEMQEERRPERQPERRR